MKKLLLIALLFSYLPIGAQETAMKPWYIGINAGAGLSGMHAVSNIDDRFDDAIAFNYTESYGGGLMVRYYSDPRMGIQLEANYSMRGWAENSDSTTYSRSMEYLEFPFLSHFDFEVKNMHITLSVGPVVSYLMSTQEQSSDMEEDQKKSHYGVEVRNNIGGGLCAGLGVNKVIRRGIIEAEFRFHQGLSNIYSKGSNSGLMTSQNQVASLRLAYLFAL